MHAVSTACGHAAFSWCRFGQAREKFALQKFLQNCQFWTNLRTFHESSFCISFPGRARLPRSSPDGRMHNDLRTSKPWRHCSSLGRTIQRSCATQWKNSLRNQAQAAKRRTMETRSKRHCHCHQVARQPPRPRCCRALRHQHGRFERKIDDIRTLHRATHVG